MNWQVGLEAKAALRGLHMCVVRDREEALTCFGIPPTAVATTGVPQARASVIVRPDISARAAYIQTDVGRLVVMGHSDGISLIRDESHFCLTDPLR